MARTRRRIENRTHCISRTLNPPRNPESRALSTSPHALYVNSSTNGGRKEIQHHQSNSHRSTSLARDDSRPQPRVPPNTRSFIRHNNISRYRPLSHHLRLALHPDPSLDRRNDSRRRVVIIYLARRDGRCLYAGKSSAASPKKKRKIHL